MSKGENITRIIPAIDIIDGKCVRLTQGDYAKKKVYNEDPLEVAKAFEDNGLKYLHLVDLDGARRSEIINWKVLEKIAGKTSLSVDFGGGIKSNKSIEIAFECGANQVTGGSIAVKNEALFTEWIATYGSDKIILGADVKEEKIAVSGWQEETEINLYDFLTNYSEKGIVSVVCTDISKDGLLQGPATELYQQILQKNPDIKLIASGGVSTIEDVEQLMDNKLDGIIIGKAIYEQKITLKQLSNYVG